MLQLCTLEKLYHFPATPPDNDNNLFKLGSSSEKSYSSPGVCRSHQVPHLPYREDHLAFSPDIDSQHLLRTFYPPSGDRPLHFPWGFLQRGSTGFLPPKIGMHSPAGFLKGWRPVGSPPLNGFPMDILASLFSWIWHFCIHSTPSPSPDMYFSVPFPIVSGVPCTHTFSLQLNDHFLPREKLSLF